MSDREQIAWQKQIIQDEYKDIKPINEKAQQQFTHTIKRSLERIKRHGN